MATGRRRPSVRVVAAAVGLPILVSAAAIAATHVFEPRDPRRRGVAEIGPPLRAEGSVLRIAGSGTVLPLARALGEEFGKARPGLTVEIHQSIGTRGGIQAVADGAIDVGLTTRRLREDEPRQGLVLFPIGHTPVVLAAHPSVPDRSISHAKLRDLVLGRTVRWSNGRQAVFLGREMGDSATSVLRPHYPALAAALDDARRAGRWRVLHHNEDMERALAATPDAVGFHDLGAIRLQGLPLSFVRIDDLDPESASYPYWKQLFLVTRGHARGLAREYIEFARSADGRRIAERGGYRP